MRKQLVILAALTSFVLAGCGSEPAPKFDNPLRAEILEACLVYPAYKNAGDSRAKRYCGCVYGKTMKGLTEAEQLVASFYLLEQVGVDTKQRPEFKSIDLSAMGTASTAIGKAVGSCPGP